MQPADYCMPKPMYTLPYEMASSFEGGGGDIGILFWEWWLLEKPFVQIVLPLLLSCLASRLLGEEDGLDVGKDAALSNGHAGEELVQLFVVPDGQLKVARVNPLLLVVAGCVTGELQDLRRQVLHHCSQVDGRSCSDPLAVVSVPQHPVDTANGEGQSCAGGTTLGLGASLASLSTSSHVRLDLSFR